MPYPPPLTTDRFPDDWPPKPRTPKPMAETDNGIRITPRGVRIVRRSDDSIRVYGSSGELNVDDATRRAVLDHWDRF